MARQTILSYDRGTLILHPPPKGKLWLDFATWDDRIEKFRIPAFEYRRFFETIQADKTQVLDRAKSFKVLDLEFDGFEPFEHQIEALNAWKRANRRAVIVLPTGAGKTFLAHMAIAQTPRSSLIVVPTLDLMQQWYTGLKKSFPRADIGLLGGGSKDESDILISTYSSAAIYAEKLGNLYGLQIFDECHHLSGDFLRTIAEYSIAPYRLGLTATLDDNREIERLIGKTAYRKAPKELSGSALAKHRIERIKVELSKQERIDYDQLIEDRNQFLRKKGIFLGSLQGWQQFVKASAFSKEGRAAMIAHRKARALAFGTEAKIRILAELLAKHHQDRVLIFTNDNLTVYRISKDFLIPAITHQTKVKERHYFLEAFRSGEFPRLVSSRVLNEGVDVPEANVAIVLSGTGSVREYVQRLGRILRKGEGKLALLYELVTQNTSEESTARRRSGQEYKPKAKPKTKTKKDNSNQAALFKIDKQEGLSFDDL